jgi:AcrR family transcriptional regulator
MGHKEALLEGAKRCLEEKGYARTTARDIVAASGTNLGSIGYHFGSKERLLAAAIAQGLEEWVEHVRDLVLAVPDAPPLQRLSLTWMRMLDDFPKRRPLLIGLIEASAQAERSPELRRQLAEHYERCRAEIAATIRASIGDDAEPAGDLPDVLASFMLAVSDGFAIQWLLDPANTPSGGQLVSALATAATYTLNSAQPRQSPAPKASRSRTKGNTPGKRGSAHAGGRR